jgi:preprotein translocase subunit SecE
MKPQKGLLKKKNNLFMKIRGLPKKLIKYLKEVKIEARKVNWPTRQETIKYTLIVIGISIAVAIFLGTLDLIFTLILNKLIL